MADDDNDLEPEHQNLPPDVQALLRQGRKAKADAEAAQAELARVQRQAAVTAAGIATGPLTELVFKDYDGPLDAEAIKARANEYGLGEVAKPIETSGPTAEEQAAQQRILAAGGTGAAPGSGDIDAAQAMRNAKSQAEVLEIIRQVSGQTGFKSRDGLIGELQSY